MVTKNKPVVIEIPEEAYKQNTVYRPWPENKASEKAGGRPSCTHAAHSSSVSRRLMQ
jgi:hypothetical protein